MTGAPRRRLLNDSAFVVAPWVALLAMIALWPRRRSPSPVPARPAREGVLPGLSEPALADPPTLAALEPGRGRDARGPAQMPARGWKDILWRTLREAADDRLPAVSAGIAFYGLMAIFPALAAFVSLYGLFADVSLVQHQLGQLSRVFPAQVISLIGDQMLRLTQGHEAKLSLAFLVSLLLSVWSANAGMTALFDGLNIAYDEAERRPFIRRRLLTLSFTLGLVAFTAAASWLLIGLPELARAHGLNSLDVVWAPLRWLAALALTIAVFAAVFRFGPSRERARWRWVRWGAVFSALAWVGGSLAFSWYVNTLAHYDATYGPLGAVVAFMLWLWFGVMALLTGAELNAEIEHQTAVDSTTGPERPMGQRGAAMADTIGKPFRLPAGRLWTLVLGGGRRHAKLS